MAKMVSGSVLEFSVKGGKVHVQALKKSGDAAKDYAKSLGILNKEQNITYRNNRNLHKSNLQIGASFSVLRSKLLLVGFATTMISKTFGRLVAASNKQQLAERKLSQALLSTGRTAEFSSDEMLKFASSLQKVSTFGDETIIQSQALLTTFTSVGKDVFPKATEAILDVSAAMGQDLQQTTIQVGKALNDPVQGMAALRRVGIQLSDAQEKQIKRFVELNDVSSAQKIILDELETQFGGMAEAVSETSTGSIEQMKNALGDLAEVMGDKLAPAIVGFAKRITGASEAVTKYVKNLREAKKALSLDAIALTEYEAELVKFSGTIETSPIPQLYFMIRGLEQFQTTLSVGTPHYDAVTEKLVLLGSALKESLQEADGAFKRLNEDLIDMGREIEEVPIVKAVDDLGEGLDFLDEKQRAVVDGFHKMSKNMATAILNGQEMQEVVVNSLKAIAAEIIANAAVFGLLNMFTSGTFGATQSFSKFVFGGFAQHGMDKVVTQPTMIVAGEAGAERVNITPLTGSSSSQASGGGGVTVNISGGVIDQDYVRNELIPALNRATGTGSIINA